MIRTFLMAHSDIKLLWASTFFRQFAYGSSTMVLTLLLKSLGISEDRIGYFMALTLIGDTLISMVLTWYADRMGRRLVMIIGCVLMVFSGLVFATSSSFLVLVIASVFGVISPSGDDVGPFRAIEGSTMAHLTPLEDRPDVFSIQMLTATAGSAVGSLFTGVAVTVLVDNYDFDVVDAYRASFYLYSIIGALKLIIMLRLSDDCEIQPSILGNEDEEEQDNRKVSNKTFPIVIRLLSVFMLDSLGSGVMPTSWVVYYFKVEYLMSAAALGMLFFWTNIFNSISAIPSSIITKRIGPIKATLVVQIPSAIFLTLIPLMPNLILSSITTILFYSTSAMDVVPRQVILSNLVAKEELTKVMGIVNIGKTFARCVGPVLTGHLAEYGYLWCCFIISGVLIFLADCLLVLHFGLNL